MAAGGVAALIPGAINVNLAPGIRAGGAIAVAVLVFYFGKDRAKTNPPDNTIVQGLSSHLDDPHGSPINPASDVYVVIDSKLATYFKGGFSSSEDLDFGPKDWQGTKKVDLQRGSGGIQVLYGPLVQGAMINVISKDPSGNWSISNDMRVPEGELTMTNIPVDVIKTRFVNGQ